LNVRATLVVVLGAITLTHLPAKAVSILDDDFFSGIPHTLVTFETDGSGNPVVLDEGGHRDLPDDEYAALGFTFDLDWGLPFMTLEWVNDGSPDFDAAQAIGGSPENLITRNGLYENGFSIVFSVPVRAFGLWVVMNNTYPNVPSPTFEAYGDGGLIETVLFEGPAIDGSIGIADYGFLGIVAEENISHFHIATVVTGYDNFMFSPVPEPATISLVAIGALVMLRRR